MSKLRYILTGKTAVIIDILSLFWLVFAFIIFLYTSTFVDQNQVLAIKGLIGFSLVIGGLVLTRMTAGLTFDPAMHTQFEGFIQPMALSLFAIWISNLAVQQFSRFQVFGAVGPIPSSLFAILIGVSEEIVFRGFLLSLAWMLTGSSVISIGFSSLVFTIFHGAVYGVSPEALIIVFFAGIFLGVAFVMSNRRLSVTMTSHGIINLLAFVVGASIGAG